MQSARKCRCLLVSMSLQVLHQLRDRSASSSSTSSRVRIERCMGRKFLRRLACAADRRSLAAVSPSATEYLSNLHRTYQNSSLRYGSRLLPDCLADFPEAFWEIAAPLRFARQLLANLLLQLRRSLLLNCHRPSPSSLSSLSWSHYVLLLTIKNPEERQHLRFSIPALSACPRKI